MAGAGNQTHGQQHAQTQTGGAQEDAPHGGQPPGVAQSRHAQEGSPAHGGGRKRQGQKQRAVRATRRGKVVGMFNPPLGHNPDGYHATDIDDEEEPRPSDERHVWGDQVECETGRKLIFMR